MASTDTKLLVVVDELNKVKENLTKVEQLASTVQKQVGPKGEKGDKGDKGDAGSAGTDGTNGVNGKDGIDGKDGVDGKNGVSVVDASVDFDNSLVLTLSDGNIIDAGSILPESVKQEAISYMTRGEIIPSQDGQTGKYLKTVNGTLEWATVAGGGSGTVTSVDMTVPIGLSISGNPITTSGTLALTYAGGYSIPTTTKQSQWDTAYSWGNHASAGYLTSYTETDPIYTASSWYSTTNNSTNWNTAFGWGNHATAGYALDNAVVKLTGDQTIAGTKTFSSTISGSITGNAANVTGTVAVANGGTGQTSYTNGQVLIGNTTGNTLTKATLTAGDGVSITNGTGSITIASPLAESTSVFTSGAAQTYTAPANTRWVKVTAVGPGGNGGAAANQRATGGSGGAVAIKWLVMNAGQTLTYTVGTASGTASTVSSGTLSITTISAGSGVNGAGTAYANSITAGPAGGTATGGDVNITGERGGHSYGSGTTVGTNFSGKGGGAPGFGSGGPALGLVATAGVAGTGFGAGGGGSHGNNTAANGTGGIIIFEAY